MQSAPSATQSPELPPQLPRQVRLALALALSSPSHRPSLRRMKSLEVLEMSDNPFDAHLYGQPHSAAELLQTLCAQPVSALYASDAAAVHVAPWDTPRALLRGLLRYKEGIASVEDFCRKELNVENAWCARRALCMPCLFLTGSHYLAFTLKFGNSSSISIQSARSDTPTSWRRPWRFTSASSRCGSPQCSPV